ncbi:hypothetical protein [Tolumonas osonensis]|uniref:Uncharacterized protein n=1 Tax=Tolumonas osonensis TaxID=675874 RepID=A0A841GJT3_9GAMM|nr:hypothetical protein [Tolumonas osonensis]MBB6054772.1 hypothetical protein [Tolumonas osonensis]
MDSVTLISLGSAMLSLIAIAVSVFTFHKSKKLSHDIAVQTHLNDYKQTVKQLWQQSRPVIEQIDTILNDEYELNKIGKHFDDLESKSEYANSKPLRHTFYDLHSSCIAEIEPALNTENPNYYRKIKSLPDISLDIKPFLKTGKFGKTVTFDILKTRQGAKAYAILNNVNKDELMEIDRLIIDKITEAFCIYTINKERIDQWHAQLTGLRQENEFDKFSIKENDRLYARVNVMVNTFSFLQSAELACVLNSRHDNHFDMGCVLHSAVMMSLFSKLARQYIS